MKYNVIAADPPWTREHDVRSRSAPYSTMPLTDLMALPVESLAAKDCVLFLWAIDSHLPEALEVIQAWGFKFRTVAFCWVKTTSTGKFPINCGWWTRGNQELCLLATRGKPHPKARNVRRLVIAERREHSRKPDEIYETYIPRLCNGPYIELFARTRRQGWDVAFSNQPDYFSKSETA